MGLKLILVIAGTAFIAMSAFHFCSGVPIGEEVPRFELDGIDGSYIALDRLKDRAVLIHFWASWCSPCATEFPSLVRFSKDYDGLIDVVAISENSLSDRAAVNKFIRDSRAEFHVGIDKDGAIADLYRSYGVPESFLVDRDGRLLWHASGAVDWDDRSLRSKISAMLEGK